MNKLISIIMPAYNARKYISKSIESVLTQTYVNWELIIIDDGSIDETFEIIERYSKIDIRIKCFSQVNGKQGKARNKAIRESSGEFLAFLDADDIWLPNKLEVQLEELKSMNVDVVFSKAYVIDEFGISNSDIIGSHVGKLYGSEGVRIMIEKNRIPILTVLAKKDAVLSVGCFNEDYEIANAEDYHLWLKMIISKTVFYGSEKILAKYRDHKDSATAIDKLSSEKLPYVYFSLIKYNEGFSQDLTLRIKQHFVNEYRRKIDNKEDIIIALRENCSLLQKSYLYPFYFFVISFFSVSRSKNILIRYLNA